MVSTALALACSPDARPPHAIGDDQDRGGVQGRFGIAYYFNATLRVKLVTLASIRARADVHGHKFESFSVASSDVAALFAVSAPNDFTGRGFR